MPIASVKSIEDYRKNFVNIRKVLDSPQEFNFGQKRLLCKHYLEGARKNFTRSTLAKWEIYRMSPLEYPWLFKNYLNEVCYKSKEIENLRLKTIQKKQEMYPNTSGMRETLAQEGRVTFDKVQPKLSGLKKFLLKMKVLI